MDIPELDEMIIRQLKLRDLSRCVRVSKKWHQLFVPYLWRDLSCLSHHKNPASARGQAFAKFILEDYLLENNTKRYWKMYMENNTRCRPQFLCQDVLQHTVNGFDCYPMRSVFTPTFPYCAPHVGTNVYATQRHQRYHQKRI